LIHVALGLIGIAQDSSSLGLHRPQNGSTFGPPFFLSTTTSQRDRVLLPIDRSRRGHAIGILSLIALGVAVAAAVAAFRGGAGGNIRVAPYFAAISISQC